jgi:hypothetical protein
VAYPTLDELQADSNVPEFTGIEESAGEALRLAAIQAVEEFCGQSFDAWTGTLSLTATRGRVLFLPRRLAAVTGVLAPGRSIAVGDVVLSDGADRLTLADWRASSNAYERALRSVSGEEHVGFGTTYVDVTGTWGWLEPPVAVVAALRADCEDTARADANDLAPTVAAMRSLGLRSAGQGNLRLDVGEPSVLSPRAVRLLSGYVWMGGAGEVV